MSDSSDYWSLEETDRESELSPLCETISCCHNGDVFMSLSMKGMQAVLDFRTVDRCRLALLFKGKPEFSRFSLMDSRRF